MKTLLTQAIIILALFTAISLQAQVTMGSDEKPNAGALLDLKMNANSGANSTKGLGLPKVELSDLSKLKIGTAPEITGADALNHTGLIVYNTKETMCFSKGLYVWDGEQWQALSNEAKKRGSYAEDVQALKDLYTANPGNTLGWNLSGDPANFAGVAWTTICGEKRVNQLMIDNKNLTTSTGIDKLDALTYLYCNDNQLTSLDVSGATALMTLHCYSNQLTSLDVSTNTALTTLDCVLNQLTSLDVSNNTALTTLNCVLNQLTSLDVSNNTALTTLSCSDNQLTSLDVSNNTALTYLSCTNNQLTSLDVSTNTALTTLNCHYNQLTSLDVSTNMALTLLQCFDNQLTSLDVSTNTALTTLSCSHNQLTSLDVSANTALTTLWCYSNQLTSLDVSTNTALTQLSCSHNQLTQAEVNKFKLHPNYCPNISTWDVTSQYFPGTTTIDPSVAKPTCP
ncbi:leucine-rich repeat domain-containing protein [Dysgonomonas sp. 25]|uniref:leucine-rich repeat domain-containing protein n=1 Tax=Dysgonomonas sp. 25 TaxID=2302933 RepID=UPI002102579D|nr:leucine-rich repeat domain-containing protein [Dysgonomonas sp. 25]